jgi:large conductance mechanosensitive channel
MLQGFKEFLFRGNIVDLAVAVVIGTAFVALVTAFTTSVINPVIAAAGGSDSIGLGFYLRADNEATFVDIGAFLTAIITFLITAAIVYFVVVVPMKRVAGRLAAEPHPEAVPADVQLLTEIRDALHGERGTTTDGSPGPGSSSPRP